jgi:hypothetical protein
MFILKELGINKYNKNKQLDLVWNMQLFNKNNN